MEARSSLTMGLHGPLAGAQREDPERVRLANQQLMSLVTAILNFARIDAGQIEFRPADVELASVVGALEPPIGPQLAGKAIASINRELARGMGGDLTAESTLGCRPRCAFSAPP